MHKTLTNLLVGAALSCALATAALAQNPNAGTQGGGQNGGRGGGRRGGMRGGGGPGGGFGQGGPGGAFGMRRGGATNRDPLFSHAVELLQRSDVQNTLHLDLKQKNAINDYQSQAQQAFGQQMGQMFQSMRNNGGQAGAQPPAGQDPAAAQAARTAQRQQMRQQMQTQRSEFQNKLNAGVNDLLRPDQTSRLHQIDLQWRGVLSIADPKIADELQISQEHRAAIVALETDYKTKSGDARRQVFQSMRGNRQRGGGANGQGNAGAAPQQPNQPAPDFQALMAAADKADATARKDAEDKALAVLSQEETARWTQAQGEPFTFRKDLNGPQA